MSGQTMERKCGCGGACGRCASTENHAFAPVQKIVRDVAQRSGKPLDTATRRTMESRFDHDFSRVRVHTDTRAADSARAVGAHAYAYGNHIAFAARPSPSLVEHELAHVAAGAGRAPVLERQPACKKNQAKVDARLAGNPRGYGPGVTVLTYVVAPGDNISKLALATAGGNTVFVHGHYLDELKALNKDLGTGTIGNCMLWLIGWTDPAMGTLPAAPAAGSLDADTKQAIATVYGEQTRATSNAQVQQKYIWLSMRSRLELGLHGNKLANVLKLGGYHAKGSSDYSAALKALDSPQGPSGAVKNAQDAVLNNWTAPPADATPYYFHWRHPTKRAPGPEPTYQAELKKKTPPADAEITAAWKYANNAGISGSVPKANGWSRKLPGDTPPPDDRFGSMYLYQP